MNVDEFERRYPDKVEKVKKLIKATKESQLKQLHRIAENIFKRREYLSFVGLFWFKEDYSDIDELVGRAYFTDGDIAVKKTILPKGSHSTYKTCTRKLPRGRVELNDGVVTITVGEKCPDSAIEKIIGHMGLEPYREGIRVIRASYWDEL
jgi:hypothetical protein